MPLFTTLAALSQTAASNAPDGSVDAPSTIDDQLRLLASFVAQLRDGSGFSFGLDCRNRLHNGNFAINQRAVAGTVTLAAGAYGHDRWKAGAGGCTYTFAASGADTVITISAGSLMQVIEDKNVEGGFYALANRGTATARIAVNGAATSGAYSTASTATPLASASATGGQTMTVEFGTGTIDRAQLEPGTVATSFERRPYGLELALCQRYAWLPAASYQFNVSQYASAAGLVAYQSISFPVPMRAAPTGTISWSSLTNSTANASRFVGTTAVESSITSVAAGNFNGVVGFGLLSADL